MKFVPTHRVGLFPERPPATEKFASDFGVVGFGRDLVHLRREVVEESLCFEVVRLSTVNAEVAVPRRLLLTTDAGDRRPRSVVIAVVDLDAVHGGVGFFLRFAGELRDVARDHGRTAGATLPVFDEGLGLALRGKPVGVGLSEVGRRDSLRDACSVGTLLETLEESLVTEPVGRREFRPQVVVALAREGSQPLLDERDGLDEVDVVLATLAVDADLHGVLAVCDVTAPEVVEFPTTKAAFELEGDQRRIPAVSSDLDHGQGAVVPVEHLRLVGLRVVVARGLGRDPLVRVGNLASPGNVFGEQSERDAVVAIRLLGTIFDVVGLVNPAHDVLRPVLRLVEGIFGLCVAVKLADERVVEARVGVFADPDAVAEELLVAVVSVVLPEDSEFVTEVEQQVAVAVTPATDSGIQFVPERVDGVLRVSHERTIYPSAGKGLVESPPPAATHPFNSAKTPSEPVIGDEDVGNPRCLSGGVSA